MCRAGQMEEALERQGIATRTIMLQDGMHGLGAKPFHGNGGW